MSKSDTWMPLYIGDYLADTMHLSGPEHGAYLLLLMHSWRVGPLPSDERALAAIARTDSAPWRRMSVTIRGFFTATDAGLISPRLERERQRAGQHIEQRKAAGKASAEARARQREGNARSTAVDDPSQRNARPSPSPEERKSSETTSRPIAAVASAAASPPPDARSALWSEGLTRLRRLTGKGDGQARSLLGQLCRAAGDDCALVGSLLHEAEVNRVGDPIPWLQAAIRTRTGERVSTKPPTALGQWADLLNRPPMADFDGHAEKVFS